MVAQAVVALNSTLDARSPRQVKEEGKFVSLALARLDVLIRSVHNIASLARGPRADDIWYGKAYHVGSVCALRRRIQETSQSVRQSVSPSCEESMIRAAGAASAAYGRRLSLLWLVQGQLMRHAPAKWAEGKTLSRLFPVLHTALQIDDRKDGCNSPLPSQPTPSSPISDWQNWVLGGVSLSSQRLTVYPSAMALMDHPALGLLFFFLMP